MATPPSQPGCRVIVQSPYKGGTKLWSNTWYLTGPSWADQTHFNTWADAYIAEFKVVLPSASEIVEAIGYDAGSFLPVFSKTYTTSGTATTGGNPPKALETCMLCKGSTDARSTKNHPIYIFKYIHNILCDGSSGGEVPLSGQKSTMQGVLNDLVAGISDGTNSRRWAGPRGAVVQSAVVETYVSHRDFPA